MKLFSKILLLLKKADDVIETHKDIPITWGTLKYFGVSVVPTDDIPNRNAPKRAFCFVTDKGAFAVTTDYNTIIPTIPEILSAYFVEGSFDIMYNGAFYTTSTNGPRNNLPVGKWCPAKFEKQSGRIAWYYQNDLVRNIVNATLTMWGWKSQYYSIGTDYTYKIVEDFCIFTIKMN